MNSIINADDMNSEMFYDIQNFNMAGKVDSVSPPEFPALNELKLNEMSFFRIDRLLYDSDYPRREAFENVLRSMDNDAFNFVYILTGTEEGVELCIGVVKNKNATKKTLSTSNYGETVRNIFEGNFNGSKLTKLRGEKLKSTIIDRSDEYTSAGVIVGIPSVNDNRENSSDFQGIDRLINSMLGLNWRISVVCEPIGKNKVRDIQNRIYRLYDKLAAVSKVSMQASQNSGISHTEGKSTSNSRSKNKGYSDSHSNTKGASDSSTTKNEGSSKGISKTHTEGKNNSDTINAGTSSSWSLEITNKKALEIMKYIDEELLERLSVGISKGIYSTSVYYMADNPVASNRLKSCLMSLFQGDSSSFSPLVDRPLDLESISEFNVLQTYQNQIENGITVNPETALLYSRPVEENLVYLSTMLTSKEISLFTGLPQTEVPGITLNTGVDFGLNETDSGEQEQICLGHMIQKGRELNGLPLHINRRLLSKHTFIAGVTGSGKTTTCHRLLDEIHKLNTPFMIIEPAKTEYRTLINNYRNMIVFTLGNESVAPFRLNPFELIRDEIISSHIDMLRATFTSAFPMEASMPQILEEAMYECYKEKGWNVITNKNRKYGENAWDDPESFPILSELLEQLKKVTESKGFGDRLQSEYTGSLISRLSNLTVGSKGCMLNCRKSVDFHYLVNHDVILEMEDLKSPEDKALIMGLIISKVSSVIKNEHREDNDYRHITLIEEAHRLLSKPDFTDNGARKAAVETFTDLLAEVRKYGEGLVIVDQIPNKLAPEVLKNTNTKIIHKILARDDKEVVGDTMLMNDKQKEFLSALGVGQAVVFTENTDKPVHVAIERVTDTNEEMIPDRRVKERFDKIRKTDFNECYRDLEIRCCMDDFYDIINELNHANEHTEKRSRFIAEINKIHENTGMDINNIWREFIERAAAETGNSQFENKKKYMFDFFTTRYVSEDFTTDSMTITDISNMGGF